MTAFYWILSILGLIGIVLTALGAYEFYLENKKDLACSDRLHMKHFEEINNGNK